MKLKSYAMISKLPQPRRVLYVSVSIFLLLVLFLAFTPWQQNAIGRGKVIAYSPTERQYSIHSPITGQVSQWFVNEGDKVKKGDKIVQISDIDPLLIQRLESERNALKLKIQAIQDAIKAAESNENRQYKLYHEGLTSRRQYEMAQIAKNRQKVELAQAQTEILQLNTRLARQRSQRITAKSDGVIYRRLTGQENVIVQQGQVLAEVIPDTLSRAAEIYIDGNDIPFVRLNQKARLEFEGWPAVQFRGWPEIAVGTFGGRVAFIDPTDNGKGLFRVVITPDEPWPDAHYLRQGVKVQGWILLGRVQLWYELWRQFNGFPPESAGDGE